MWLELELRCACAADPPQPTVMTSNARRNSRFTGPKLPAYRTLASNEAPQPTSAYETRNLLTTILGLFSLAWLGLALVIAAGMFLVTPTYFRLMFSSPMGWLMILVAAVLIAGGVLLTLLAMRWMK